MKPIVSKITTKGLAVVISTAVLLFPQLVNSQTASARGLKLASDTYCASAVRQAFGKLKPNEEDLDKIAGVARLFAFCKTNGVEAPFRSDSNQGENYSLYVTFSNGNIITNRSEALQLIKEVDKFIKASFPTQYNRETIYFRYKFPVKVGRKTVFKTLIFDRNKKVLAERV
jgi:hypothetical protein